MKYNDCNGHEDPSEWNTIDIHTFKMYVCNGVGFICCQYECFAWEKKNEIDVQFLKDYEVLDLQNLTEAQDYSCKQ